MPNVLTFDVSRRHDEGATVITPCIDGVMLTHLAGQFEQSHELNDPAGGYGGLVPDFFQFGPLDQYFLGKSATSYFASVPGRIFVLGCECGEVGCWPLACYVEATDRTVIWQGFEQPHRPTRDYSAFGPYVFDRKQYDQALRRLPKFV